MPNILEMKFPKQLWIKLKKFFQSVQSKNLGNYRKWKIICGTILNYWVKMKKIIRPKWMTWRKSYKQMKTNRTISDSGFNFPGHKFVELLNLEHKSIESITNKTTESTAQSPKHLFKWPLQMTYRLKIWWVWDITKNKKINSKIIRLLTEFNQYY